MEKLREIELEKFAKVALDIYRKAYSGNKLTKDLLRYCSNEATTDKFTDEEWREGFTILTEYRRVNIAYSNLSIEEMVFVNTWIAENSKFRAWVEIRFEKGKMIKPHLNLSNSHCEAEEDD